MKYPLAKVRLIDSDENVLAGYAKLQNYIKDELNCLELFTDSNEDAYIQYKVEPDNKAMGQVFKKKFDKNFKTALANLTNDQIKEYLANGKLDVNGNEVVDGMLKVQKSFNAQVSADKDWACESKGTATVMLDIKVTPELKRQGLSREITNRIQRLRKTSGISIEDQIDIFYQVQGESPEINQTLDKFASNIEDQTRMPLLELAQLQGKPTFVGETEFVDPENESEQVKIYIYMAKPEFNDQALQVS